MTDTTANQTTPVVPSFDKNVDAKDMKFRWKKDKLGNQRPNVEVKVGVPSVEGFVDILTKGGKYLELLQDAASDVVRSAISAFLADNETAGAKEVLAATTTYKLKDPQTGEEKEYTVPAFSWEGIAFAPASDRRASTISEDDWTSFGTEYIAIMPGLTAKTEVQVATAVEVFVKKLAPVKTNKEILKMLQGQLAIFVNNTKKGEEFAEILELLTRKLDTYLQANDVELLIKNL